MDALEIDTEATCLQDTESCIQINTPHCAWSESLQAQCCLKSFIEYKCIHQRVKTELQISQH